MILGIGVLTVLLCILGGYVGLGGHLHVLWQPFEYVIIAGSAIGIYIIAGPKVVLQRTGQAFKMVTQGSPYKKENFVELLSVQYAIFKLANRKGLLALEKHIEDPHNSSLFAHFPHFKEQTKALEFICDYLRLLTLGGDNPHQLEELMDQEIEVNHHEFQRQVSSFQNIADTLPALGIVAAVLGVIKTMGAITEPPEV